MSSQVRTSAIQISFIALFFLGGCTSVDNSATELGFDLPQGDLGLAYSIIPYGRPQTELVEIPEEKMMGFLECTEDALGRTVEPVVESSQDQDLAASDCALEFGLDEYVEIWSPVPQSELAEARNRWIAASETCFRAADVDPIPTIDVPGLGPEPDFLGAIAQDPSLEDSLRECMTSAGQDIPGHDH